MALYSFIHGVFLKKDSYVFLNTWNTDFYIHHRLGKTNQDTRYDMTRIRLLLKMEAVNN